MRRTVARARDSEHRETVEERGRGGGGGGGEEGKRGAAPHFLLCSHAQPDCPFDISPLREFSLSHTQSCRSDGRGG